MTLNKTFYLVFFLVLAFNRPLFANDIDCSKAAEHVDFFDICVKGAPRIPSTEEAICAIRDSQFNPHDHALNVELNDRILHRDRVSTFFCANYAKDPEIISELLRHPKLELHKAREDMIEAFIIALSRRKTDFVLAYLKRTDFDLSYQIERHDPYDLKHILTFPINNRDLESFIALLNHPSSEILSVGLRSGTLETLLDMSRSGDPIIYKMAQLLIQSSKLDPNFPNQGPLKVAIYSKDVRIIKLLLSNPRLNLDFPIEKNGETPLSLAIKLQSVEVFDELLKQPKININPLSSNANCILTASPIVLAIESSNNYFLKKLLERSDLDFNSDGRGASDFSNSYYTPLGAALVHNISLAEQLLKRNDVDVNHHTCGVSTPIYQLYSNSVGIGISLEGIRLLLNRVDTNVNFFTNLSNDKSRSVLKVALNSASKSNLGPLQLLLKRPDLNVNQSVSTYDLPLHSFLSYTINSPQPEVLMELLKRPDINCNINIPKWWNTLPKVYYSIFYENNCHIVIDQ